MHIFQKIRPCVLNSFSYLSVDKIHTNEERKYILAAIETLNKDLHCAK